MTSILNCLLAHIILFVVVRVTASSPEAGDDAQSRYGSFISRCEYESLRLGTELSDVYNAPDIDHNWNQRVYQNEIVQKLGFAPWIANGIPGSGGKTLTGQSANELHGKNKWVGVSTDESPYQPLNHKWIYMFGDSTTRQVWASFAAPFKGNSFERNAKEWTRHYCNKQEHRKRHGAEGNFDEEGWRGPCGKNEVSCHISGYGDGGLLSFDWKHFPFEDYDEYLWGSQGPWVAGFQGEGIRRPDFLTIQFGLHTCFHAVPEGKYSKHLNGTNEKMIEDHIQQISKLMAAVRKAMDTQPSSGTRNATTVVILTSGTSGLAKDGLNTDACIQRINRATTDAAHLYGFAVLDRGEIERRLTYKSLHAVHVILPVEMHLVQPAQNIIATSILHMYTCLTKYDASRSRKSNESEISYPLEKKAIDGDGSHARPMHTPP